MIFNAYAAYYDLIYKDKNYSEEANYVHQLIKKYAPSSKSILDLGCGTGKHALEFSRLGYSVVGVDQSASMILIANTNALGDVSFYEGDIRDIRLDRKFDVVVALFHVMSYQVDDKDLLRTLQTAAAHLNEDGILIFDCWYGPGVLNDPPTHRVKEMQNDQITVTRIADPEFYPEEKMVNVKYQVYVNEKGNNNQHIINEEHKMRYLFEQEVQGISKKSSMKTIGKFDWMKDEAPEDHSWNAAFVLQKT